MPRTYQRKRPAASKERLEQALDGVRSGELSVRDAARSCGIVKQTIYNHLGKNSKTSKPDRRRVFDDKEEKIIADHCVALADCGVPITTLDLRNLAKMYLDRERRVEQRFRNNLPGEDWASSFMKRNNLKTRIATNISVKRNSITPSSIEAYFERLQRSLQDVPPQNILNYDETAFCDSPGSIKAIFRRGKFII